MSAPAPPITKWSFSLLKNFERCPYAVYLQRVEKVPQPPVEHLPNHPLTRGKRIHKEAELYVKGKGPLTKPLERFAERLEELRDHYAGRQAQAEDRWGFDQKWASVDWNDPNCWLMLVADALIEEHAEQPLTVIDYKTGKSYGKEIAHTQQMQLYSTSALMRRPEVTALRTELWYLDEGKVKARTYTRAALPELTQRWSERAYKLTRAIAFPPKPNIGNCRFCPYSPNEGGNSHCAFGVEVETKKVL